MESVLWKRSSYWLDFRITHTHIKYFYCKYKEIHLLQTYEIYSKPWLKVPADQEMERSVMTECMLMESIVAIFRFGYLNSEKYDIKMYFLISSTQSFLLMHNFRDTVSLNAKRKLPIGDRTLIVGKNLLAVNVVQEECMIAII